MCVHTCVYMCVCVHVYVYVCACVLAHKSQTQVVKRTELALLMAKPSYRLHVSFLS